MLIDSHCHVQFSAYKNDAEEVIKRCQEKNVVLNVVGSQRDTSERAIEYANKYDNIYATVGLHPVHLCSTEVDEEEIKFKTREETFDYEFYKKLVSDPKVIGIGECGLELFHLPENLDKTEVLKKQKDAFVQQYNLAQEFGLPLVIHVRDAHEEMVELLQKLVSATPHPEPSPARRGKMTGVVHCYSANWQYAQQYLNFGLYLGFTGIITFPPKKTNPKQQLDLLEVVKKCPLDKILIETDAPYLAPQAYRGERCEPWMVEEVAKKIAEVRGLNFEDVCKITVENTKRLFSKISK